MVAPFFGTVALIPKKVRLMLSMAVTGVIAPMLPPVAFIDPFSAMGVLVIVQQLLLGLAMGLVMRVAFASLMLSGAVISMPMGLGFANIVDPQNGTQVPVVSSLFTILGTLLFLAINAHLVLIQVLYDSFTSLPIAPIGISKNGLFEVALWGGRMYVGGVLIALPAIIILTLINLTFGVMTRAAPQLNIFAVGFPTTMAAGFLVIFLTLPNLLPKFTTIVYEAFDTIHKIMAGA